VATQVVVGYDEFLQKKAIRYTGSGQECDPTTLHPKLFLFQRDLTAWAMPIWYGIQESDTLNVASARDDKDDRHICPLQLGTIRRCIMLWSNVGDLVLDPFMGIGSTGYESIKAGRRFVGCELKESYFHKACENIRSAERILRQNQSTLF
jgi:DNA modification methylase